MLLIFALRKSLHEEQGSSLLTYTAGKQGSGLPFPAIPSFITHNYPTNRRSGNLKRQRDRRLAVPALIERIGNILITLLFCLRYELGVTLQITFASRCARVDLAHLGFMPSSRRARSSSIEARFLLHPSDECIIT
jgi:hypothetical protein